MKTHELKTWPAPFGAVVAGTKRFEIRRDDRGFEVGDRLLLREYDPRHTERMQGEPPELIGYTGKWQLVEVTYVARQNASSACPWEREYLQPGCVVLGFGPLVKEAP